MKSPVETLLVDNLITQISQGEGQETEFKTSFQKEVIETVVAFANAKGGKILLALPIPPKSSVQSLVQRAYKTTSTPSSKTRNLKLLSI